MIVGTTGHIDHGKTTLVKALTGVDTDRLPEEKKRGISIELGYAYLDVPGASGPIGFVDMPGHERLVHTMIAGASGIDFALLLVAADDGVMPQTREHLALLSLLGIERGVVVITKADRVTAQRAQVVLAQCEALLRGTSLDGTPILVCSAVTGQGLPQLRALLLEAAAAPRPDGDPSLGFRLAIDRVFTLPGIGTVLAGLVHAGTASTGAELALAPATRHVRALRVRSVHAQNRAASRAEAGQRCALAVAGLAKDEVQRGQWLVSPEVALATDRIDIQVRAWRELERPVRSGARVHLHAGATRTEATVTLLDTAALAPGETACAQLTLPTPIGAWRGDRVVLRDAVSGLPLAGGRVLDPWAPRRYRRAPSRLAGLAALQTEPASQRLDGLVSSSPQGLNLSRWARAEGRLDDPLTLMPRDALPARDDGDTSVLAGTFARALEAAAVEALRRHHAAAPDEIGLDAGRLRVMVAPRLGAALWDALLRSWQQAGQMRRRGTFMQLPEHGSRLSTVEQKLAERLLARLLAAGPRGVKLPELLNEASSATQIRITLSHMARNGSAHQVAKDLYYPAVTLHELAGAAQEVARVHAGDITAAHFRDAIHVARRRAILVLEYFDRVGLTRRVGDVHRLQGDIQCFASDH